MVEQPHPSVPATVSAAHRVDRVVTVVELVVAGVATLLVTLLGLLFGGLATGVDPESDEPAVLLVVVVATWVLYGGALGWSIRLLGRREVAFWVPLLAVALWLAAAVAASGTS